MIYKIVEFRTGRSVVDSTSKELNLRTLKKVLSTLNIGALLYSDSIKYALACHLPSEAFVVVGRSLLPTPIKELSPQERQIFWNHYATTSSYKISVSEFNAIEVQS
ncbi:hypothetical protein [Allocoleopsis sp.]|uniref:hypothetical protein n=1 Tax=Allocoleopsis sp. TaxID=3088169 RepID=UPI002FD51174